MAPLMVFLYAPTAEFDDAIFDISQTIMVLIQDLAGLFQIDALFFSTPHGT